MVGLPCRDEPPCSVGLQCLVGRVWQVNSVARPQGDNRSVLKVDRMVDLPRASGLPKGEKNLHHLAIPPRLLVKNLRHLPHVLLPRDRLAPADLRLTTGRSRAKCLTKATNIVS